jgi:hypothetical protein
MSLTPLCMPKSSQPVQLPVRYDGPTRYVVPASKQPDPPYLVELEAHGLTGQCTCPHYENRMAPLIAAGERGPNLRCKHVLLCRAAYATEHDLHTDDEIDASLREYAKAQSPAADKSTHVWPPPDPAD